MKTVSYAVAVLLLCVSSFSAAARDEYYTLSISEAMHSPEAQGILRKEVKVFFSNQGHPQVLKELGEQQITKKARSPAQGDKLACLQAFFGAVLELQDLAIRTGGNAVIGVHSDYKDAPANSASQYICGSGRVTARVVLTGRIVRVGGKL
jgi:hypothetical protein